MRAEIPRFSVVIPTYNRSDLVTRAVQSVLDQSFVDFEIIVVDNGGNDDTDQRIKEIDDSRIHYVWQAGSGSPASPRNHGIALARGEWVAFLDSDDSWRTHKLERVAHFLQDNRYDLVAHWQQIMDFNDRDLGVVETGKVRPAMYRYLLLHENPLVTSATLVRRAFLSEKGLLFDESPSLSVVEDFDLWLRIAHCGGQFGFIPEALGVNREHGESLGDKDRIFTNMRNLLKRHANQIQKFSEKKESLERRLLTNIDMMQAMTAVRQRKPSVMWCCIYNAWRSDWRQVVRYFVFRLQQNWCNRIWSKRYSQR